jgi:hypothetical protein
MITLNGIVGISLLVGALKHHLVIFNASGSGSADAGHHAGRGDHGVAELHHLGKRP